ncbi:MAG: peptide/nickel transport system substrate-binding protein [Thermomicrobiales bacterium]|jgi:peptide/nickel transport system substrate-binding protein|nr:peptide/nickel transport system substrate-binding protein [Thermomicrobiales bacterium]
MKPTRFWSILVLLGLFAGMVAVPSGAAQTATPREETLKIAIDSRIEDPTNFNITNWAVNRSGTGLHQLAYEYFFYDNLQTGEYIPWLAESFEYSADFTSLNVKLRDGVTWNDGKPFTPEDVVFTYDTMRENPTMSWADVASKLVKSVEKVDNLTVKFNLAEANPRFHLNREAFPAVGIWGGITILPKHVWEGQDPLTFKNNPPVSTGPYRLKDASQTAVIWERRDDWWGTKVFGVTPPAKEVQFLYLGAETNVALALVNNEIDTPNIGILSPGSFQEVARRNPNVRAWEAEEPFAWADPCPRVLMVQNATPPLDKKEVRWALSYLIDRQGIVDLAYEGTTTPAWGIWPEYDGNQPYFEAIADLREKYPSDAHDPAKAEELLKAAGVAAGDLKLRYVVNADSTEEMTVATVLADQLMAAGIEVEIQPLSGSVLTDTVYRGDYDLKLNAFCPGYIAENLELFHSKYYVTLGEKAAWFERNSFRYKNPALDAVIDKMFKVPTDDTAQMIALYKEAMAIWLEDLPVVPVVQAPALVPFNSTYWENWPTAENAWNMPVSWWATFNLVLNGYPNPETGEWVAGIKPAGGS